MSMQELGESARGREHLAESAAPSIQRRALDTKSARMAAGKELSEALSLVPGFNAGYAPRECFWLANLLTTHQCIEGRDGNRALHDLYMRGPSLDEAALFRQALEAGRAEHSWNCQMYRSFFSGVVGHAARVEAINDLYSEPETVKETPTKGIFGCFFHDLPPSAAFSRNLNVRYDPERMLCGLAWLEKHCEGMSEHSPLFAEIAGALRAFRRGPLYPAMRELLFEEFKIDPARDYSGKFFREWWRDQQRSQIEDFYMYAEPGDRLMPGDYNHASYISYPCAADEWSQEDAPPPTRFSYKMSRLSAEHPGEATKLEKALVKFEYLLAWGEIDKRQAAYTILPALPGEGGELLIRSGRSPSLVSQNLAEPERVTANSLILGGDAGALVLTGANGRGKTQLLSMVVCNTLNAHRGLPVFAAAQDTPALAGLEYGLNLSEHSASGSAFQNEVARIMQFVESVEAHAARGERSLLVLDEPLRGTDRIDAAPLIAGLLRFLQDRGCLAAVSTHFTSLGTREDLLSDLGVAARMCTMSRDFELIRGVGASEGIEVADRLGLNPEIVEFARGMRRAVPRIAPYLLPEGAAAAQAAPPEFRISNMGCIEELRLAERRELPGGGSTVGVSDATRVFAAHSPLGTLSGAACEDWGYCNIREEYSAAFVGDLLRIPSGDERDGREAILRALLAPDAAASRADLSAGLANLGTLRGSLALDLPALKNLQFPIDERNREALQQSRLYSEFAQNFYEHRPRAILETIHKLAEQGRQAIPHGLDPALAGFDSFARSGTYAELTRFVSEHPDFPSGLGRNARHPDSAQWELFREWAGICGRGRQEITDAFGAAARLNFYLTVANTVHAEGWCTVERSSAAGEARITQGLNTLLAAQLGKTGVTANDLDLRCGREIQILSGTNGGGKTQFMQMAGSLLVIGESTGYMPAQAAVLGRIPFLELQIAAGEHSEEHSSFQNEVLRIREILGRCEAQPARQGGIIMIDEPFKGTSEEEAVPLLLGLMNYCSARGMHLMFTTHFSSVFDRLDESRAAGGVSAVPLYVDYFSQSERFKVRDGIGASSGIRVAEELGLPEEIIRLARIYAAKAFGPSQPG